MAPPGEGWFLGADKVGHAIAYFATTLSFLFAAVWRPGRGNGQFPRIGMWVPLIAVVAGERSRSSKGATGHRSAELLDVVAEA